MPKQPDSAELIDQLKSQGVQLRLRKSGQVHTLDFTSSEPLPDDQQLAALGSLQSLEVLNCHNAPLTDASLDSLLGHESLKLLTLTGTHITSDGLKRLRQNMIGCRIVA